MRSRMIIIGLTSLIGLLMVSSVILASQTETVSSTTMQQPEPTLDPFPRPTDWDIIVAEQVFENGRMFYLAPNGRIWVLIGDTNEDTSGEWQVYADSWKEGDPESDASFHPPDGMHQPIRGFGKLWRENDSLREALGWALDPEIGHHSRYQFFGGEMVEADGGMVQDPGTHRLTSIYGRTFVFDESGMTWSVLDTGSDAEAEATEEAVEMQPEATATP